MFDARTVVVLFVFSLFGTTQAAAGAYDEVRVKIMEPLRRFEAQRPTNCDSDDLQLSYLVPAQLAKDRRSLDEQAFFAGIFLEVADSALQHSCLDVADKLYRFVISAYTQPVFSAYRQRAEIGVQDVREARKSPGKDKKR